MVGGSLPFRQSDGHLDFDSINQMIDSTEKNAENAFRKGVRLTKTHQLDDDFIHVLVNILRIDPKRRASTAAILAFRFFSRVQSQANKKGRSYVYEHPLPKDYDWAVMNVNVFPVGNFDSIIVVADANKEPGKAIVTLYPHPCLAGRDCALLYRTETFPLHEHIRAKGHQALPSKAFGFYDPCWYLRTRRFVNRCFVCMNWGEDFNYDTGFALVDVYIPQLQGGGGEAHNPSDAEQGGKI